MVSQGVQDLRAWAKAHGGIRGGARAAGVPLATFGRYLSGESVPAGEERLAQLEQRTGIRRELWTIAARPEGAPVEPPPPVPSVSSGGSAVPPTSPADPAPSGTPSLAEMQTRLRAIPGELAELRASVNKGTTTTTSAETLRRLLTDEAKALSGAIASSGLATNEEVEQLRALLLGVVQGCEGCRKRLVGALRELER